VGDGKACGNCGNIQNCDEVGIAMKFAVLRGNGLLKNIIFDRNSPENRDDCFAPYVLLKDYLLHTEVQIETSDEVSSHDVTFELHQDFQQISTSSSNYLLMLETEFVKKEHGNNALWGKYRKIFTWNDDLVDGNRFVKINFPNQMQTHDPDGFGPRSQFCCLISANKTLSSEDDRILYAERVNAIRWFETHAPLEFDLYGGNWNLPVMHSGLMGKLEYRFWRATDRFLTLRPFPSYRGRVEHKRDVLKRTRFSICYENVRDLPGYITEKIFDCFFSGCVPVYWGASNIADYIPADCFIDRRKFDDTAAVYKFLKEMDENEFMGYQQRIADFLRSDAVYPFGSEFFAETIVNTIAQDLGA
jgi:alpha(1,3/1,4) fucosyltransferase